MPQDRRDDGDLPDERAAHGGLRPAVALPGGGLVLEPKQLAAPASLDTSPLDLDVEDHGTSAPLSVRKTDAALGLLEDLPFAAWEEPELFAAEIRAAFRSLR
jgi:hypothetical protein